ncbi:MAG: hypothetical protein ACRCYB_10035, partial [Aeromonas veronii]
MDKKIGPMENLNAANYTGAGRACQGLFIGDSACLFKKTARSDHLSGHAGEKPPSAGIKGRWGYLLPSPRFITYWDSWARS